MREDPRVIEAKEVRLGLEVVPRVVYSAEPVTVFSTGGGARMSSRRVAVTRSVEFSPVDYARCLRQWSALYMPDEPRDRMNRQVGVGFGVVTIGLTVVLTVCASTAHSGGLFAGAVVFGLFGFLAIKETGESARRRRRAPGAASAEAASWARGEAYVALEQGHFGRAAAMSDQAAWSQAIAEQQRASAARAAQSARRADEQYWSDMSCRPLEEQWAAAHAFRGSIAAEWARRTGDQARDGSAPVPTYRETVAWLRSTPVAW